MSSRKSGTVGMFCDAVNFIGIYTVDIFSITLSVIFLRQISSQPFLLFICRLKAYNELNVEFLSMSTLTVARDNKGILTKPESICPAVEHNLLLTLCYCLFYYVCIIV